MTSALPNLKEQTLADNPGLIFINFDATESEPYTWQVDEIANMLRADNKIRFLVGIGGGSVMDVTKAVSICMTNDQRSRRIMQGWDMVPNPGIYKIGVPTIFGSGAEASRTAVLNNGKKKQGINSDHSMFDAIILDPNLSATVDKNTRFYSGMDCYIHCVESIEGTLINQLSRAFASTALEYCIDFFDSDSSKKNCCVLDRIMAVFQ